MRDLNRTLTIKWKKRRREKHGDRCRNAKCFICHSEKVLGIPSVKIKRENQKLKNEDWD